MDLALDFASDGATVADTVIEFFDFLEGPEAIALITIALAMVAAVLRPWQVVSRRSVNEVDAVGAVVPRARPTSGLRDIYDQLYAWIVGVHPYRRIWHSQWLSAKDLYLDLRRILPSLRGRLVDVGCLGKPYSHWLTGVDSHLGLDVTPGDTVDYIIRDGEQWPIESNAFQSLLCTQVLQVVKDLPHLVREIDRVLEVGGIAVITTPFFYNDMTIDPRGEYKDYWRHTFYGAQNLFADRFDIIEAKRQGGFGSTAGVMVLNWVHKSASRTRTTEAIFLALLPLWLLVSLLVNAVGWLLDKVDRTDAFYHNVLLVLRKRAS